MEDLDAYLAGGLDEITANRIERHLLDCDGCSDTLDALEDASDAVLTTLSSLPASDLDEADYLRVREAALKAPRTFSDAAQADALFQPPRRLASPLSRPLPYDLGNYELIECLGCGASGAVYRARHVKLDQSVAVKVFEGSRHDEISAFLDEMKAIGPLTHKNVVRATDAGEADGLHYLVMEHVSGIDASKLLRLLGALRVADACEIARQTAEGLRFIHSRSLVHRDVKPSNLLVTADGCVKLLDLGIAVRDQYVGGSQGKPLGTVDYMSPEHWESPSRLDARADLYSLGCTLFKLISGRVPTSASVEELTPSTPRGLRNLVQRLLSPDPENRPASAQAVVDALLPFSKDADLPRLLRDVGVGSDRVANDNATPRRRTARLLSRRRVLVGAGVAAAAGLMLKLPGGPAPPRLHKLAWRNLRPAAEPGLLTFGKQDQASCDLDVGGEICLNAEGLALLHLGRPVSGVYSIETKLLGSDGWRGGIFFQGCLAKRKTAAAFVFQTIELELSLNAKTPHCLLWSQWTATSRTEGIDLQPTPLGTTPVALAPGGRQTLRVTCGRRATPEVVWNGEPLSESQWSFSVAAETLRRRPAESLPTAFLGRLGLATSTGRAVFAEPRIAYL